MRAALYCRVSTEEQARNGLSLGDQREKLEEYAKQNRLSVVDIYEDAGISARKPYKKRPAIIRLLEDVRAKKIDIILFTKLDRWFRNVGNYYAVQDVLDAYHVNWKAILEDYETVTASGRLKVNIMLSVAQDEADRTSERIKFTFEQKRSRGESTNGRCPLGYKIVDHRPDIDQETKEAALDMFRHFIQTRSVVSVTKYMRENWNVVRAYNNFRRYLQNEVYIGKYYETECPALISSETWIQTQSILKTRGQRNTLKGAVYLFTGIIRCADCGSCMTAETVKNGYKEYIYYRCPKKYRGEGCEHKKRVREDYLEEWLLTNLASVIEIHNLKASRALKKKYTDTAKIKAKMEKLKDLYLSDLILYVFPGFHPPVRPRL